MSKEQLAGLVAKWRGEAEQHRGRLAQAILRNKANDLAAILATLPEPGVVTDESVRVGNLPTMNQDGYPGLGEWWVQLWRGDEIIARVYGDGPDEVRSQAQDIADALNQQPAAVDGALDRMRQAPPRLWRADLVGQQISVERMRDILAFALAAQQGDSHD